MQVSDSIVLDFDKFYENYLSSPSSAEVGFYMHPSFSLLLDIKEFCGSCL